MRLISKIKPKMLIDFKCKIEMALGSHPYAGMSDCAQLNAIDKSDPPKLENPRFTVEFCDFIAQW
jgi:hypothetical protein